MGILTVIGVFISGVSLGIVFFGGLWWTVGKLVSSARPAIWIAGSFILRTTIVIGGFLAVSRGDWVKLLTCTGGFFVARHIVLRLTRRAAGPELHRQEAGNAA